MSFPNSPTNNQQYQNALGAHYIYSSAKGAWLIQGSDIQGITGLEGGQGITGLRGFTGALGSTGADGGAAGSVNICIQSKTTYIEAGGAIDFEMPFSFNITDWTMMANESGYLYTQIYRDSYANFPPTVADIMHSGVTGPNIINANKNTSATSSWPAPTGAANSIVRCYIASATGVKRCTLSLRYQRTY